MATLNSSPQRRQKVLNELQTDVKVRGQHQESQDSDAFKTQEQIKERLKEIEYNIKEEQNTLKQLKKKQNKLQKIDEEYVPNLFKMLNVKKGVLDLQFQYKRYQILRIKVQNRQKERKKQQERFRKEELDQIQKEKNQRKQDLRKEFQEVEKDAQEKKARLNEKFKFENQDKGFTYVSHRKFEGFSRAHHGGKEQNQERQKQKEDNSHAIIDARIQRIREEVRLAQIQEDLTNSSLRRSRKALIEAQTRLISSRISYRLWSAYSPYYSPLYWY